MEDKPAYRAAHEARQLAAEKRRKMNQSVQNLLGHGVILPKMDVIAATVDQMTEVVSQLKAPRGKLHVGWRAPKIGKRDDKA